MKPMKRVIDTSEVLGTVALPDGEYEVCATADAQYDDSSNRLVVELKSFLRTTDLRTEETQLLPDWLPKSETVTESVGPEDALEVARDVFHGWVRKVREATPYLHATTR